MRRLLIANRGEIACRIIRTARSMGLDTVAVYSDADAGALHVKLADKAVRIGPPALAESYLSIEQVVNAGKRAGADAVHPGYGFLSENADFAQACVDAGMIFVGPSAEAIGLMGNKAAAKDRMQEVGVPCIPGYQGADQSLAVMQAQAQAIGFPIMVKAAAGGGGRGMRLVTEPTSLPDAVERARSEAEQAFGSGELILEKAIIKPRHVEIQVMADAHGTCLHLGERDCSVQRRHQKIIEESPCPVMTDDLRERMGAAAVMAARSIDYRGAGTVEFLLDGQGEFYFLEMNTRLQVEHPVTEMVTGLDLVAMQLRVAMGDPLGMDQADVRLTGHAIETRLYAEDPSQQFLPSTGPILRWHLPKTPGVRVDAGIEEGGEISPFFDPLVAKIITHGKDREEARRLHVNALKDIVLLGPRHNGSYLLDCLENAAFAHGEATTAFVQEEMADWDEPAPGSAQIETAARVVLGLQQPSMPMELSGWSSSARPMVQRLVRVQDREHLIWLDGGHADQAEGPPNIHWAALSEGGWLVGQDGRSFRLEDVTYGQGGAGADQRDGRIVAPMHGTLLDIQVSAGDVVEKDQPVVVMEAMKMQHVLKAPKAGRVEAVHGRVGEQLAQGTLLLLIEEMPI